jgi:hypothetical protein
MPKILTPLIAAIAATLFAGSAGAESKHEKHSHNFAKDIDAFHAALAPLWHASAGKARSQKTCAQANKLETLAKDIHSGDATALLATIGDLKARCQTNPTDINATFSEVHEAFHRLIEAKAH